MDITVKKLCKSYADKIVFNDFSIEFKSGKVTAIMGKSGSGKTTLLNCIASLTSYDGEISGADRVSYVFQEDRLVPGLTVYGNLALVSKKGEEKRIREVLSSVELSDKAVRLPKELSGGEKKRVALARAFLSDEDIMLLDEPFNSLDFGLKHKFNRYFLDLIKKSGKLALFVTHDIDEALSVADDLVVLDGGKVVYSYEFSSDKFARDITNSESNSIRQKLMELLV